MTFPSEQPEPEKIRLERLLHTPDHPEGVPYRPPAPRKGYRHHVPYPGRVTERWVCEGGGRVRRARTRTGALRAWRTAAASAS